MTVRCSFPKSRKNDGVCLRRRWYFPEDCIGKSIPGWFVYSKSWVCGFMFKLDKKHPVTWEEWNELTIMCFLFHSIIYTTDFLPHISAYLYTRRWKEKGVWGRAISFYLVLGEADCISQEGYITDFLPVYMWGVGGRRSVRESHFFLVCPGKGRLHILGRTRYQLQGKSNLVYCVLKLATCSCSSWNVKSAFP